MSKWPLSINDLADYDFYILNLTDHKSIAINFFNDIQYEGITFYKTNLGWELNPTKIGKGYITLSTGAFDFTKSFKVAIQNADQTK